MAETRILYVSGDNPTEIDRMAEAEVTAFDPLVTIQRVDAHTEISTPRLAVGRSHFRGLSSIRSFIRQEKLQPTHSQR